VRDLRDRSGANQPAADRHRHARDARSILAERLVTQRPDLRVVFVSGYSDAMPGTAAGGARMTFLPKPFTAPALIAAVQRALAPAVGTATPGGTSIAATSGNQPR
jgi:DNA-binding NtrC family response regulator